MADSSNISVELLRERLADTDLPDDPGRVIELPGSRHWPASLRDQLAAPLTPAGVLIPIFDRQQDELSVLLTQRSAALRIHAGQISFPGGRMEPGDVDIEATALRETHEEVGISHDDISVIGYLPAMPTITGYAVTPVVGVIDGAIEAEADHDEVELTFEVPLAFLADPANQRVVERNLHGKIVPMREFHYAGHRIWGATAMMIIEFIKVIKNK